MLRYTTDRARPGLVALYNIRPGNVVGQLLQPRSPHGESTCVITFTQSVIIMMLITVQCFDACGWASRILKNSSPTISGLSCSSSGNVEP